MQNYIQPGKSLTLTAPYAVASGAGAKVGSFFGVAKADYGSGDDGEFMVEGVYSLAKTTSQAWTQGDKIYWNDSTKKCTTTATAGMLIGRATEDAGSTATTGKVALNESASELATGEQAAVAALTGTLTGTADGALVDVAATAGSCAGGSSPTAANVDTAIATAVATIVSGVNTQNKELMTKLNELIAAVHAAGITA